MQRLDRPQAAIARLQVGPLVLEVVAVAHVLHVHRLLVGRCLVVGHALFGIFVDEAVFGLQQRAVRVQHVVAVARIVVGEFPVALVFDPVGLADHDLAARIAVQPFVDRLSDRTEMLTDRRRRRVQCPEDEAAIGFHARHLREVELRIFGKVFTIALGPWHAAQFAIVEEIPAVIRALERPLVAFLEAAQRGPAMGTAVVERTDDPVAVARHDQRTQAEFGGDVVVNIGNLAFVRQVDPGAAEDMSHLGVEDRSIRVEQMMDAVFLDQFVPVIRCAKVARPHGLHAFHLVMLMLSIRRPADFRRVRRNRNIRSVPNP